VKDNYNPILINEPKKNISLVFITIYLLVFLLLVLSSEIVFMISSNSPELNYLLLSKVKHYAQINELDESFKYLNWVTKININYNHKKQKSGLIPKDYGFNIDKALENTNFTDEFRNILQNIDVSVITNSPDNRVSEIFYGLGLVGYSSGLSEVALKLLQTSIFIEPELSFYHVELANYYLTLGDKTLAGKTINYCLLYKDPYNHCKDYLENSLLNGEIHNVGFMREAVNNYYLSRVER